MQHPQLGRALGADLPKLLSQFQELFHQDEGETGLPLAPHREFVSDNVIRLLREGYQRAVDHGRPHVTSMDLLICLLTAPQSIVAECFERIGVTAAKLTEIAVIAEQYGGAGDGYAPSHGLVLARMPASKSSQHPIATPLVASHTPT